ncbi:D-alanine--D-alanine ligase family protein [Nocardioides massiliensis]|uniref:D-alanine--D-alanine ligase n=1 Tax=Nocardioides massiliensis TaxID=1325935 RepID=A0ABT9NLM8_9ACTN|nr:D-alanine--D-alanine ligase [Nocardioides massiliensis]MDP9821321.1 D-alanine-D-alanine ligase [Nocardioides massiliensis]
MTATPDAVPDPTSTPAPALAGRVVVLAGGLSHERDVSLRSGRRVAEAMRAIGVEVEERDVDASLLPALAEHPPACVVPLLHGESGEDGAIREVLELLDLPYVGSRPAACRVAFDKPVAKSVVARAGLNVPPGVALPHETFRELGATAVMDALVRRLGLPLMVKPAKGGSALGASVVHDAAELPGAMVSAFAYGTTALVERFIPGMEVAVAVVDDGGAPWALPAVGIEPDGGVYDYTARYTAGSTKFSVPAKLDDDVAAACAQAALTAHTALGLRDVSRSDLIIDADGTVWFLEVNVAPGLTETSTVPLAAQAAGLDLGEVVARLARRAVDRCQTGPS